MADEKQTGGIPQNTQGSGSAEQTGKSRDEQKNRNFNLDDDTKNKIASDIGVDSKDIVDLHDLHADSGRDDYAGGSGDGMSDVSTNEPTDHL